MNSLYHDCGCLVEIKMPPEQDAEYRCPKCGDIDKSECEYK